MKNTEEKFIKSIKKFTSLEFAPENKIAKLQSLIKDGATIDCMISKEKALLTSIRWSTKTWIKKMITILEKLPNFEDSAYYWILKSRLHTKSTGPIKRTGNKKYHDEQTKILNKLEDLLAKRKSEEMPDLGIIAQLATEIAHVLKSQKKYEEAYEMYIAAYDNLKQLIENKIEEGHTFFKDESNVKYQNFFRQNSKNAESYKDLTKDKKLALILNDNAINNLGYNFISYLRERLLITKYLIEGKITEELNQPSEKKKVSVAEVFLNTCYNKSSQKQDIQAREVLDTINVGLDMQETNQDLKIFALEALQNPSNKCIFYDTSSILYNPISSGGYYNCNNSIAIGYKNNYKYKDSYEAKFNSPKKLLFSTTEIFFHELDHYSIDKVFDYDSLPYLENDKKAQKAFDKTTRAILTNFASHIATPSKKVTKILEKLNAPDANTFAIGEKLFGYTVSPAKDDEPTIYFDHSDHHKIYTTRAEVRNKLSSNQVSALNNPQLAKPLIKKGCNVIESGIISQIYKAESYKSKSGKGKNIEHVELAVKWNEFISSFALNKKSKKDFEILEPLYEYNQLYIVPEKKKFIESHPMREHLIDDNNHLVTSQNTKFIYFFKLIRQIKKLEGDNLTPEEKQQVAQLKSKTESILSWEEQFRFWNKIGEKAEDYGFQNSLLKGCFNILYYYKNLAWKYSQSFVDKKEDTVVNYLIHVGKNQISRSNVTYKDLFTLEEEVFKVIKNHQHGDIALSK